MSDTRYGRSGPSAGTQDQGERKDQGWESRQGGRQSRAGDGDSVLGHDDTRGRRQRSRPPLGTNTQGLAGIAAASDDTREQLAEMWQRGFGSDEDGEAPAAEAHDSASVGTDQPPRMSGPLGPDPDHRGVDASAIGAVHQGVKKEDTPDTR
jgi:hypothetical protein